MAGGGHVVSAYIDDDGFKDAIVNPRTPGRFVQALAMLVHTWLHVVEILAMLEKTWLHFVEILAMLEYTRLADLLVTAANGTRTRIDSRRDITLQNTDKNGHKLEPIVLSDVSHCRWSQLNLMSVAIPCENGTTFHLKRGWSYTQYSGKGFPRIEENGIYLRRLIFILHEEDMLEFFIGL
jgi:hypothetical protein